MVFAAGDPGCSWGVYHHVRAEAEGGRGGGGDGDGGGDEGGDSGVEQHLHPLCRHLGGVPEAEVGVDDEIMALRLVTRYEAASTIYGPHTLAAYIQQYTYLTQVTCPRTCQCSRV